LKKYLSSRILFISAFILFAATNIIVLWGVAANRSGKPEAHATLTQRELALPYRMHEENSGLALQLEWRVPEDLTSSYRWNSPAWLDSEKLEALGFDLSQKNISKQVFIVLEYDGKLYKQSLEKAKLKLKEAENSLKLNPENKNLRNDLKYAKEQLEQERHQNTRLFAMDAGLDADRLRLKYKDRSQFIIAKGLISTVFNASENSQKISGYISKILTTNIYVPLKYRPIFDALTPRYQQNKQDMSFPRFEVSLAFGNRFEPWITDVKALNAPQSSTQ